VIALAAVAAATRSGEIDGQAISLRLAGQAAAALGDHDEARVRLERSLGFYEQLDVPDGLAAGHLDCARICVFQGTFADAVAHALQGLKYARETGIPGRAATALNGVGWCLAKAGEPQRALAYCEEALTIQRDVGDSYGETLTLDSIGYIHHLLGNYDDAIGSFTTAVAGFARSGDRWLEANSTDHLADVYAVAGNLAAAAASWHRVLAIMTELEHPGINAVRAKLAALSADPAPA
jgi:tetratricopeptide (TPR) repeat protein